MSKGCMERFIENANFQDTGFSYTMSLISGKHKMVILYCLMEYQPVPVQRDEAVSGEDHGQDAERQFERAGGRRAHRPAGSTPRSRPGWSTP